MEKTKARIISIITMGLATLLLVGCGEQFKDTGSSSVAAPASGQGAGGAQSSSSAWDLSLRQDDAGQVVIEVQPLGLEADQAWEFDVAMNTHSVDLDFDLTQVAVLRCERGGEHKPVSWEGSPAGGHHRQGVLRFVPLDHSSSFLELVILGVAGVPQRVFRWEEAEAASTALAPVPRQASTR